MSKRSRNKSDRPQGREFAAVVWAVRHPGSIVAPSMLLGALGEFGPTATGAVLGGAAAGVGAWYRAHPDTFDTYAAPVLRAWKRRWAGAYSGRSWRNLMSSCGLTRTHPRTKQILVPRVIRVRSWSSSVDTVRVSLVLGMSAKAFIDAADDLADSLKAERVAMERTAPGEVTMIVQRDEPFTFAIPSPELAEEVAEVDPMSLYVGEDEFGREYREPLFGTHFLRAGETGSGKNSLPAQRLRAAAPLIRAGLVRPWVIDPKMMEWSWLKPILDGRYADNPKDGMELLDSFVGNMERKQKRMQRAKLRKAPVSHEFPIDWLIFDEIGYTMAYQSDFAHSICGQTAIIASTGRTTHDVVEALVQEPTKDTVPVRELLPHRVCLRASSSSHPDMVLGDGMRARGAVADELPQGEEYAGIGFARAPKTRQPRRIRVAYTDDAQCSELVSYVKAPTTLRAVS
ncbi:FtsK/SpoIIIE domain-containing protein [Lentzea cavernae]|uniref:Cell division protein FtsK n=1 Tax=Lentzea cavernae TaxID=2020703 RepID=A0ABQ3MRY5_9PSEU|nr:FtsK/SpoIIIE domain-containing protein [Lentzea cavernae]GHH59808.1 cell division protein FtsK [Lentzea cavernae]